MKKYFKPIVEIIELQAADDISTFQDSVIVDIVPDGEDED